MKLIIPRKGPEEVVEVKSNKQQVLILLGLVLAVQAKNLKTMSEKLMVESERSERIQKIIEELLQTSSYCKRICRYLVLEAAVLISFN